MTIQQMAERREKLMEARRKIADELHDDSQWVRYKHLGQMIEQINARMAQERAL